MANTKGNTAVIFTVIGVATALGITIYLITRKSKAIDQSVVNANAMAGLGQNPIYANTGNVQGSNSNINAQLGIGTTATNPYVAPGPVNTPHGGANTGTPHGGANTGTPHGGANTGTPHGGANTGGMADQAP